MKFGLPTIKKEKGFPDQFFAIDFGGKLVKIFVLDCAQNACSSLGSRQIPQGEGIDIKAEIAELKEDFPDAASLAVVGVCGPETTAFTTVVRGSSSHTVEDLAKHAREEAAASAERELRMSVGDPKIAVSELESEILEVKESEKQEVFIFSSFATSPYLSIREQFVKQAGLELWGFSSLPFNLVAELSKETGGEDLNALIFDIGGAKTELSLIFGSQLMETKSFWWDFAENGNPATFLDMWLEAVSSTMGEFEGVDTFPPKIFLAGGASAFPGLLEVVSSYPWSRDHHFEIAPEVIALETDRMPLSLGQVALRIKEEGEQKNE